MGNLGLIETPCLLLDADILVRNIARMAQRIGGLGCVLRPHVKTHKSISVAQTVADAGHTRGITVSTLHEAEYFFRNGHDDILYAVGITPNKLDHAADLRARGCDLKIILDHPDMARAVVEHGVCKRRAHRVLIEVDTDGHRSGVDPRGEVLIETGRIITASGGAELVGVMAHAGGSYGCATPDCLLDAARRERDLTVLAARRLRVDGARCPIVSIGSTPTALAVDHLEGVTEVRAGVYTFFDLVMAGIGVCGVEDIAISVLASVIGHQRDKNWVVTDAGWMALSRDRGTATQTVDQGYGLVAESQGSVLGDLVMTGANQEHGIISRRGGGPVDFDRFPLGGPLRILPNHACATAAQFDRYHLVRDGTVIDTWSRSGGW
ncbi:MAG: alanine racemase [Alphaproteobacteria bacterium]